MNLITVNFIPCEPTPPNGYNVQWRVKNSIVPFTDAGNFFTSPAVFTDDTNPAGTQYEGIIRSDCTESGDSGFNYGSDIIWNTEGQEESGSGAPVCRLHEFAVFGGDGENIFVTGLYCNGDAYTYYGFVGDGAPPSVCLQLGSVDAHGTNVVLINDLDPCP